MATTKAIWVSLEGFLYLQDRCKFEKRGKHLTEEYIEHLKNSFERLSSKGYMQIIDGYLDGYENGKRIRWTADQMAEMLTEQGLDWKPLGEIGCVEV